MGTKGDKLSNQSNEKAEFLVSSLKSLGNISSKKMFGGNGVFSDGKMFAMVDSMGECFLKVDEKLESDLAEIGSEKHSKMPYSSIPEKILNDKNELINWSRKSILLKS
ncbi:DNA transformation protein [Ulvibacter sp. MAR_2010_11]|uniref:TfoX/Sxy family protein n=1 Tax=Ulvibacter sp. MAR_2010_11 TaxID=1250229 RepID=UPI000C2CAA95|nr:TfoX/Sxy family protein [Ulvibacter sp. MAR_2010_11]PKA81987.1 DNA transformation protein [Ulvibacter sp. MAR_2010_11]